MQRYKPGAVVIQCGADSVAGDRLGKFNLSIGGHAECVRYIKSFNIPCLVLGGGGYTIRNVARTWLYETAVCLNKNQDISDEIPKNEFSGYFGKRNRLHLPLTNIENKNSPDVIHAIQERVIENLRNVEFAPSVSFGYVPQDFFKQVLEDAEEFEAYQLDWGGGGTCVDFENTNDISYLKGQKEYDQRNKSFMEADDKKSNNKKSRLSRAANNIVEMENT